MSMAPPRQARGDTSIESMARPVAVDHRISLPYYFRIADNLLRQANIYGEEKNLLDLYIILLRYSSLLCETIPKHRDYHAFKSREKEFLKKGPHNYDKLLKVVNELESLKPVVQLRIAELNRGGAEEPNDIHGTHATSSASSRMDQLTPSPYTAQPLVGRPLVGSPTPTGLLQKSFSGGKHQAAPPQSVKPDRQLVKSYANLAYPKEETLSRHSILGPNGLSGQWTGPGIRIQYPSNLELTQSDITSLVPAILNQDGLDGPSTTLHDGPTNNYEDMQSVLSLDDGRWSLPVVQ